MTSVLRTVPEDAPVGTGELLELLHRMARIRVFEERVETLNRTGRIPGFLHTSIGQEATAVGICAALRTEDYLFSTHRGHGHLLAKGGDMVALMGELYGKQTGQNRGKGGSMHVADFRVNMLGANGIVGGGLGIAVGAALSSKLSGAERIALAVFGEGASTNGAFHESLNLAAVLSVPVVFVCENNLYAHEAPAHKILPLPDVADHASVYGMPGMRVDGNDVVAVLAAAREAVELARSQRRPVLLEAKTYRHHGHHGGDRGRHYRPADEIAAWLDRDPLVIARSRLERAGARAEEIDACVRRAEEEVEAAITAAEAAPYPSREEAFADVWASEEMTRAE